LPDSGLGTSHLSLGTQKRQGPGSEYQQRVRRDAMQAAEASSYFDGCTPLN